MLPKGQFPRYLLFKVRAVKSRLALFILGSDKTASVLTGYGGNIRQYFPSGSRWSSGRLRQGQE